MKKILTVLLSAVMLLGTVFAFGACGDGDNRETLYVYTNAAFAPWEYLDSNGNVAGVDIDIANEIGNALGYKVVVRDIAFNQVFEEVKKDEMAIGVAGITITAERQAVGIFSMEYATSVQYAIIPESMNVPANLTDGKLKLSALAGKKIGVQLGTTGNFMIADAISGTEDDKGAHVKGDLEGSSATCVEYNDGLIAGTNLGGQIDCLVIDKLPAQSIAKGKTGYVTVEIDAEPEAYGIFMNKKATVLQGKINKVLKAMIDNGVIEYYILKHSGAIL